MEEQLLHPIEDSDAPQFKCIYLPYAEHASSGTDDICTFVFIFNHAIIDGMSTMATLRRFLLFLNDIVSNKKPNIEPWPKMHPPSEYYFRRAVNELPEEKRKALEATPTVDVSTFFKPKNPCLFVDKMGLEVKRNPKIPFSMGLTIKTFTEEQGIALRLACRANNATIQAAAQIAGSIALAKLMQDKEEWEPMEIKYNLAANLRPHIAQEISVDYTGLYVSLLFGFAAKLEKEVSDEAMAKTAFWKLAKESTNQIREQIKNKSFLESFYAFNVNDLGEMISNLDSVDMSENEGRGEEILYTTSYGAWDFPTEATDQIKPVMIYSNSSIQKCGQVFSQQLITVNGKMSWVIGWSKRVVSQETAEKFAQLQFDILEKAIKDIEVI